ncbi:CocE/NonD family hydrolase [Actinoplanes sp. NEAU-A12]|uniref:CocE/NonD family hydrolase n=1 Tax=Actinoplanes sandaracinus TaxID=3045177 RepID=A0ABT6WUZ4_9ACTN|nr:CocE/NonD family hydrolase [Actinoplanes sandaracinus]MDI6103461.1 CocE/NonD family hydrolase [Actinoplanes sandaracinus]
MTVSVQRTGPGPLSPDAVQHMVRMRDGVHLATDVYLPPGDVTPGPTILTRLPYDKCGEYTFMPRIAAYFTARGYRMVVQDVRGKFRSEGETLLFVNEAYDGYDTLEWVINQPWSDGVAGMWGDSYYGYTQWAAASTGHRALKAMVPRVTGTRLGELPVPVPGQRTHDVEMSVHRFYPLSMFHDRDILDWEIDWTRRPLAAQVEEFFTAVGSRSASYDLWFPHPVSLRRFPAGSPFDAPAVPVLMTIGWWDNCAPWQWSDHRELRRRPGWARNEYLLLEAIDHENTSHFSAGEPATVETMAARYLDPAIEFFDVFLRGRDTDIPRVRWQLANSGDPSLRAAAAWPLPEAYEMVWRPSGAEAAVRGVPGGTLAVAPDVASATAPEIASWTHDAADPVPSPVIDPFAFLREFPDERHLADRPDVLVFTAPAGAVPLDLAGPIRLDAVAGSDGPEMDLFARLLDVAPDGTARLIARGQQTIPHPGDAVAVTIDLGQTGYRLPAGHALRLTVASSDAPEFVPAPGTGEHRWLAAGTRPNRQRLDLAATRLTCTVLPS